MKATKTTVPDEKTFCYLVSDIMVPIFVAQIIFFNFDPCLVSWNICIVKNIHIIVNVGGRLASTFRATGG